MILDLGYDESVMLEVPKTTLIGENSKKYIINMRDCINQNLFDYMIDGKKTDTKSFEVCFDVDKDVKKFDIMFNGLLTVGDTSNTVKIGTIQIKK